MKATVRKQGSKTEVEDEHASFTIDGGGNGRILVMGKEMSVSIEIPASCLGSLRALLDKHLGRRDR